jgi:methionyl-tRNA formyltransferase
MISKETGRIDWNRTQEQVHNLVRGTDPWPGAYTFYKGERMRVWKTEQASIEKASRPGEILEVKKEGILVGTGKGILILKEIQFDSGKRLKVEQYLAGHSIEKGELLGK